MLILRRLLPGTLRPLSIARSRLLAGSRLSTRPVLQTCNRCHQIQRVAEDSRPRRDTGSSYSQTQLGEISTLARSERRARTTHQGCRSRLISCSFTGAGCILRVQRCVAHHWSGLCVQTSLQIEGEAQEQKIVCVQYKFEENKEENTSVAGLVHSVQGVLGHLFHASDTSCRVS